VSPENHFRALIDPRAVVEAIGQSPQLQALPVHRYREADAYPEGATAEMRLFDMQIGALEVPDDTDTRRRAGARRDLDRPNSRSLLPCNSTTWMPRAWSGGATTSPWAPPPGATSP
jgi:hypothetical protein